MSRPRVSVCKNNHQLAGDNLFWKNRSRQYKSKMMKWREKCCKTCYDKWRYEYDMRKFGFSNRTVSIIKNTRRV